MLHEEGNFSPHSGRWHGQNWTFPWCCLLRSPPGIKPSVYQQLRLWEYRTHIRSDTRTHENILHLTLYKLYFNTKKGNLFMNSFIFINSFWLIKVLMWFLLLQETTLIIWLTPNKENQEHTFAFEIKEVISLSIYLFYAYHLVQNKSNGLINRFLKYN